MSGSERDRICAAVFELSLEVGYRRVTLEAVLARAGVDEETFRRHFEDVEEAFLAVLEPIHHDFLRCVGSALIGIEAWQEQIHAVGWAMHAHFEADVRRARLLLVESGHGGERVRLYRDQGMQAMYELIDRGRDQAAPSKKLSRATAEALGGAMLAEIADALEREGRLDPAVVPQMIYTVVLPYAGTELALREMQRPPPPEATLSAAPRSQA